LEVGGVSGDECEIMDEGGGGLGSDGCGEGLIRRFVDQVGERGEFLRCGTVPT